MNARKASRNTGRGATRLVLAAMALHALAVQSADGRIFVFGHVGGDDAYGKVDQSIVMDSFRLKGN